MGATVAVVACMDARYDPLRALDLEVGQAYVLRNGGGLATPDVVRGLALAAHLLGVEEVVVAQHTDCKAHATDDAAFRARLADEVGHQPEWSLDQPPAAQALDATVEALRSHPLLAGFKAVRGVLVDIETGRPVSA